MDNKNWSYFFMLIFWYFLYTIRYYAIYLIRFKFGVLFSNVFIILYIIRLNSSKFVITLTKIPKNGKQ